MSETDGYYAPLKVEHVFDPYPAWQVLIGRVPSGRWVVQYVNLRHPQGASGYERRYFWSEQGALDDAQAWGCDTTGVARSPLE